MPEEPTGAPRPAPARSRRRRLVRLLLGLTLLLLLLHTPPARLGFRVALERLASRALDGRVQIGTLDYRLWAGSASVSSARLERPGLLVLVERLDLGWSPGGGLSVTLLRPRVEAWAEAETADTRPSAPATGLAARPWGALERLSAVQVQDGRVELAERRGQPWLLLGGIDAEQSLRSEGRALVVHVRQGAVGQPGDGLPLEPVTLEARLGLAGGRVTIEQARLAGSRFAGEVRGVLERVQPFEGSLDARVEAGAEALERFAPGLRASGRVEAQAKLTFVQGAPRGPVSLQSDALLVHGLGPWSTTAGGRVEGHRLVLDAAEARAYGGRLALTGGLALGREADTELRLQAEGFDLAVLVEALGGGRLPLASRAAATLTWSTHGWDLAAARGEGRVVLAPRPGVGLPLAGEVRLLSRARALEVPAARLVARELELRGQGSLNPRGLLAARWEATLPWSSVPPALADLGLDAPRRPLQGQALLAGELSGSLAAPVVTAQLGGRLVSTRGHLVGLDGELRLAGGQLSLAPVVLRSGSGEATFAGRVPLRARDAWELEGDVRALDTGALLATLGLDGSGPVSGRVSISGPAAQPRISTDLEARLTLAEAGSPAAEPVVARVLASGHDRQLHVESLTAELAGGRVSARGSFDRATGQLEGRLEAQGLQAERLPWLPPALAGLDGVLGFELQLAGTSEAPVGRARATLGEARLGDSALPALELSASADGRRLELAGRAGEELVLQGAAPLEGSWPARLEVEAGKLPLQALLDASPEARGVGGRLAAQGRVLVELPLRDPAGLRYSAQGLVLTGGFKDRDWSSEPFDVRGDREALALPSLRLRGPHSQLELSGSVPLRHDGRFDLRLSGQVAAVALEGLTPVRRAAGEAVLQLALAGTPARPELSGRLTVTGDEGRVGQLRWRDLALAARFGGGQVEVESAQAQVLGGQVAAAGSFPLRRVNGGKPTRLRVEVRDVDLGPLLAPDDGSRTERAASLLASLDGQLDATGPALEELALQGQISRLDWSSRDGQLGLEAPAVLRLARGRAALEGLRLAGSLGALEASAQADLQGSRPATSGLLTGSLDLAALNTLLDESTTLAGATRLDLRWSHGPQGLQVEGQANLQGGRVTLNDLAFSATPVEGRLDFAGRRVTLEATGAVGEGRLRAQGEMQLGPALLGPAELRLELERVPLAYPKAIGDEPRAGCASSETAPGTASKATWAWRSRSTPPSSTPAGSRSTA